MEVDIISEELLLKTFGSAINQANFEMDLEKSHNYLLHAVSLLGAYLIVNDPDERDRHAKNFLKGVHARTDGSWDASVVVYS